MSGSDSDADCCWEDSRHRSHVRYDTVIALRPSEEVYDQWLKISADTKREAGQRMKICAFWLPILLQPDVSSTTANWAVEIGLIKFKNSDNISMKQLHKIEILEAILRAMERGSVERNQTKHIFSLSNMFNLRSHGVLDDALRWLERTGEPAIRSCVMELGHAHTCYTALHLIFTEFAKYVQDMGSKLEKTMKALMAQPSQYHIEKCEEMKKKGNEKFSEQRYEEAMKFYSKAIKYWPDNHLIYGNRALCYIKCEMWLKAVGDGKRAMLIKPVWAKGHYRYCDALFSMGAVRKAIDANKSAQILCKNDNEGLKDLEQQFFKFTSSMADPKAAQPTSKNKRVGLDTKKMPHNKVPEDKMQNQPVKNERIAQMKERTKDPKPMKSEFSNDGKAEHTATTKKKERKNRDIQSENDNQKVSDNKAVVCRELRSLVQDAHTALADLRSRNAEQAFSQALALLETTTPKELGLSTVDLLLLLYGRVSTLTEIGQSEELSEAQKLIEKMKSFEERTFQCLVYYAAGRLYLKENRFAVALEQFSDSLQMVKNQITPGKLTWPLTKEIVKETQLDNFKEILECAIEFCKFPPNPDAICRLNKCHSSLKTEIYLTDPDFKGFIKICCCQSCTVEYHIMCWKTLKTSNFFEKNEKDFLQEPCLTPDCVGQICSIKIYGPTGLVKCKFEASIPKAQTPKKPKLNQKCTSLKKLKSKEARRLKRKQHKQSFQDKQDISDENLQQKETSASQSEQKAWLVYRDRVLLQISQNMELLREETNLHVSVLITNLRPWLELDSTRGNQLAEKVLNWEREQLKSLGQAVELLLERKNRVWARVLIQLLSSCLDINSKLNKWACRLNDAGLNAAKLFVERYAGDLEQLDLAPLLNFGPLQEMIIEKLGTKPELFSGLGLSVTDYLKQASPHDMRLFIWTMEEHRDDYLSCHSILDQYFDMMDGQFSVLKKSDENENNSPMKGKSRGRKKKQNQKGVFVLSGMRGPTPRDEWEQDIFEDDSLSFLHPVDSFSVPSHLRDQVADFEDQYNSSRHRSRYKKILDNNPDPTKESLYDYFAQILEEHGPLVAEDPLLVGELENFPHMAQLKIQEAGGFESFLLESLRFIKMGRSIGLAKHAVSLQQGEHGASLDDLDIILDPDTNFPSPDLYEAPITNYANYVDTFPPTQTEAYHIFPNPYQFPCQPVIASAEFPSSNWSNDDGELGPYVPNNEYLLWDELVYESDEGVFGGCATSFTTEENIFKKHAAAQTCPETMSSVAVNTEFHERFESCQGDMNKKEKDNRKLEQQIVEMIGGCDRVNLKHKEDIDSLEEDIHKINVNIQVTNKELALFHQKLEEEVKKDQKEKKANQETLKSLKLEIEGLVEEQGSLVRNIREKKASYDTKFRDFLELGNQSAAEKMSLEDEIKHCRDLFASATRRSHNAQLSVMESGRDQGLYSLYRELADAKSLLTKLDEAVQKFRNQDLEITRNSCRANVQEIEKKISTAETQYQEQIDQAKLRCEMPPVNINNQPKAPAPTLSAPARAPSSVQPPHRTPPLIHESAAEPQAASAQTQHKPPPITVFDKSMERLSAIFPDYTKSDLMRFVQEFRSSSGGSLGNMALQDVVSGVTQRILDHQEKLNAVRSSVVGRRSPAQCPTPPLVNPVPVWQPVVSQRPTHPNAINMEDPCIICHDDMSPDDMCVLECRHSFHNECIRSWLKEQSTCPTCRDHALLPDDFPVLPGRRRQAP